MGIETALITGLVASVASAGVGAAGAISSADAQANAAKYNAEVAAQNEQVAKNNATQAAQAGEVQANTVQQKTRAEVGALKANEAASGVDVNTGSPVDVRSSAASLGELNAITVQSNAAKTAYGYQTQAAGFGNESTLDTTQAANDETAGEIGAGSTLLGGLSSGANNWEKYIGVTTGMNAGSSAGYSSGSDASTPPAGYS